MSGTMVDFPSNGKTASGYLVGDSGPGVIVIQEWWGLNDQIKGVADRYAAAGFRALAPDLYHGTVTRSPDEAGKLLMALDIARAGQDLQGAVTHLRELTQGRVGTVGFCMGGALSLYAACAAGDAVGGCVIYYGGHPRVSYDFDSLRARVLGHWAEHDGFANANIPPLEQAFAARHIGYEFHTYPGTKHAFGNEQRPEVYDAAAYQLSWDRTIAFFHSTLA
jgi:carboxymethylenebutenolidase